MANKNPLSEVQSLVGGGSGNSQLDTQLTTITQQLQLLQGINQTQITTTQANTAAVAQSTGTKSGTGTVQSTANTLESVFGFGLGLSPLISGLVSLFGGGGQSAPAPLVPFVAPLPVNLKAGVSAGNAGPFAVDTGAGGLPRAVPSTSSTQVTVNVQAMDSQSFLDHSHDIAAAVRQAMLTSTTLNDVIREL
jgi:hypothetical protein